ncbi:hypothetical protein [Demequina sp. NBRC 110052]|uniref:hypothetical protein n=1 Tax=Demequina sp. NBRC 110052 TaxID=1570341 RepID=UPI000A009AD5|nr:hypothetical protein [Demequina sp. NBRC 110052]
MARQAEYTKPFEPTEEWARFGPWIDRVTRPEDVPPLFRGADLDLDGASLVLKVPRDIAHRDAKPDMDLYDHLVVIDDDGIEVLTRHGSPDSRVEDRERGYETERIGLAELVALHDAVNLLHGRVTLYAADGRTIRMRHSGSPRGGVGQLIDAVRDVFERREPSTWGRGILAKTAGVEADLTPLERKGDLGLVGDLHDLRAEHRGVTPWACHRSRRVWPGGSGLSGMVERAQHVVAPVTLQGGILAGDERVLEVLGRHAWLTRGSVPTLSSSRLTLPLAAVDGIEVEPDGRYPDAVRVRFRAGGSALPIVVPSDSPMLALLQ